DRNPNTGHTLYTDDQLAVAHQTIYHDGERPSYIVLPIIPSSGTTEARKLGCQVPACLSNSAKYRRRNSSHFFGSCPNQRRSKSLGATSFTQASSRSE